MRAVDIKKLQRPDRPSFFSWPLLVVFIVIAGLAGGWYVFYKPIHGQAVILPTATPSALGVWCFNSGCAYFDRSGQIWGNVDPATNPVLVQDQQSDDHTMKPELLAAALTVIDQLPTSGLGLKKITFPSDLYNAFTAQTVQGFPIYLPLDNTIASQLKALQLLIEKKGSGFAPQYIDLKIPGRAYYK